MSPLQRIPVEVDDLASCFGFGVAGNFAGHLEQAGEAGDFANVAAAASMPKGIFPWYVPGAATFLGAFPLSADALAVPEVTDDGPLRIQVEPELSVLCDVVRDASGEVTTLVPRWVAAFDDCSLRRPHAARISEKKNWGADSKGLASTAFAVSDLEPDGELRSVRLACFLRRGDETHAYGIDSPVASYSLFGQPLLDWLVDRLRAQRGAEDTPLEDVGALLAASSATSVVVGVGATRYEAYGESTYVAPGDEAVVALYDADLHESDEVAEAIAAGHDDRLLAASVLRRRASITT